MSDDLISEQALRQKIDKIKVSNAEIVVNGTKEKPYFEIKYFDLSDNEMHIGFSSYKLDVVFGYLEKYFEIVDEENKPEHSQNHIIGDLISRKSLIENLNKFAPEHYNALVNDLIAKEPTAFDKEKVIEELKGQIELVSYNPMTAGRYIKKDRVIKIVEKGGIE